MENNNQTARNAGLDLVRSMAIILVLIAHYSLFFSSAQIDVSSVIFGSGFFGVELFFVLSGFLIGRIVIRTLIQNSGLAALLQFWKRRWLRTLPAYYLVWLVFFIQSDHNSSNFLHLLMLQSFFPGPRDLFFGVSWSLASEEWFYLLAPLLLYLLLKIKSFDPKKLLVLFCLTGIILAPLLRTAAAIDENWGEIRKSSFIRLDAFLFGILLASLQYYYAPVYKFLARQKYLFLLLSGLGLVFCARQFLDLKHLETSFNKTLLFSLTDLCFVPFLIACETATFFNHRRIRGAQKLIHFISVTSYSVYLIHWDLMVYFRSIHFGTIKYDGTISNGLIMLLACTLTTYIIAYFMYRFWEKPFMHLRDGSFFRRKILLAEP